MEYINLKKQYLTMKTEIDQKVMYCMKNAAFIMGDEVNDFEFELKNYVGMKYAVSCGNGTDALQLAYMAHGIGKGDAVFCPDMTFIASIEPACLLGATPVFCDIEEDSLNIDAAKLELQINNVIEKTDLIPRAVVAVDFLGNPADFDNLKKICDRYDLLLIEDGAQSMGAIYKGRKCGSLGDIATTSFFPSKPLGGYGDGGAVFTNDEDVAKLISSLRVHGKGKTKYDNIRIGVNSRLDSIQAAVLRVKLKYLDKEMEQRQILAQRYCEELKSIVKLPKTDNVSRNAYAQFVIQTKSQMLRDELGTYLEKAGIPTIVYYPNALHNLPVFEKCRTFNEEFSNAVKYGETNIGLPFSAYLSEEEQEYVITKIQDFYKEKGE